MSAEGWIPPRRGVVAVPTVSPRGEAGAVSISSEHPVSADQIYRALMALGADRSLIRSCGPRVRRRRTVYGCSVHCWPRAASFMAVVTASDALGAHLRLQRGDVEGVRQALGRTEASLIGVLQGIHGLRIAIGDAQEEPKE